MNDYLETEREIKGYVDISYSKGCANYYKDYNYPLPAPICFPDAAINSYSYKNISENYASLEENYFLLDGSFVLPDYDSSTNNGKYGNYNSGYITNEILSEYSYYSNKEFVEDIDTMRGLTLYFKDNIPKNIKLTLTVAITNEIIEFEVTNNDKLVLQFDFANEYLIQKIEYYFSDMEYTNRRLRVSTLNYGLTDVLSRENGNLIQFKIIENMSEFNLDLPSNQCTVELYDEENKFDLLNPSGFTNLLNSNVVITPYIGILTEENGILYQRKGMYFLDTWDSNKNNITLNCTDYFKLLKNTISYARPLDKLAEFGNLDCFYGLSMAQQVLSFEILGQYQSDIIEEMYYYAEGRFGGDYYDDMYLDTTNVFDYLKNFIVWVNGVIYSDNYVYLTKPFNQYNDELKLDKSLLEQPRYELRNKLKDITITKYISRSSIPIDEVLVTQLNTPDQTYVYVDLGSYMNGRIDYYSSSTDSTPNSSNFYNKKLLVLYFGGAGLEGPYVKIYQTGAVNLITQKETRTYNTEGVSIEIDNKFFKPDESGSTWADTLDVRCGYVFDNIANNYKNYNVEFDYIGDPKITPYASFNVETQYGMKQIKVLEHTLTFDGGLTGHIKGVGD